MPIDFNSLFSKKPQKPVYEQNYVVDPNDPRIQGFDYSPQKAALMQDISRQQGNTIAQTRANNALALGGGSRSTGTAGQLADIGAQSDYARNKALAEIEMQDFQSRSGLMDAYNKALEARNRLKQGGFEDEMGAYNSAAEAQAQNQAANMQLVGSLWGGGAFSGKGAARAAKPIMRG